MKKPFCYYLLFLFICCTACGLTFPYVASAIDVVTQKPTVAPTTEKAAPKIHKLALVAIGRVERGGEKDILVDGNSVNTWESKSDDYYNDAEGNRISVTYETSGKAVWSAAPSGSRVNLSYNRQVSFQNIVLRNVTPNTVASANGSMQMNVSLPAQIIVGEPFVISGKAQGSASGPQPPKGAFQFIGLMQNSSLSFIPSADPATANCDFKITFTPETSGEVKGFQIGTSLEVGGQQVVFKQGPTLRYVASLELGGSSYQFLEENVQGPSWPDFIRKDHTPKVPTQITSDTTQVWLDVGVAWTNVLFPFTDESDIINVVWVPVVAEMGMWKPPLVELPKVSAGGHTADFDSIRTEYATELDAFRAMLQKGSLTADKLEGAKGGSGEAKADISEKMAEECRKFDKEIFEQHNKLKRLEKQYFEKVADYFGELSDESRLVLREYLWQRVNDFHKASNAGLDEMREKTFNFSEDSTYFRFRRYYEAYLSELQQLMGIWNNCDKMEITRLDMLISTALIAKGIGDPDYNASDLLAWQTRMKNVYLDEGWIYLVREQVMAENGIDARDSYGAALKEARQKNLKYPWHNEFLKRQSQAAIYGTQYVMAIFGTMWSAFIDSLVKVINAASDSGPLFDTLHETSNKQIKEVHKKTLERLATMAMLRNLTSEQINQLGSSLRGVGESPIDEKRIKDLENDRMFNEAMSGGLLRLYACYQTEWEARLEAEYRMSLKHAKLAYAEMRKTLNVKEGREESGKDPTLKRMIDPMGSVKTIAAHYIGKQYDAAENYLAERNGQIIEMEGLLPKFKLMAFDFDYLKKQLPINYQIHYSLAQNNPDYMSFMQQYNIIASYRKEVELRKTMEQTEDTEEKARLGAQVEMVRQLPARDTKNSLVRILKQQLAGRIAVSDFDGILATARQLEDLEPAVKEAGLVNWLTQDLAWEHAKEIGINTAVSVGNNGLYAAFYARYFGPVAVRNQPVKLSNFRKALSTWDGFKGFLEFTWGQVNPFASITAKEMGPKDMAKAIAGVTRAGVEQIEQDKIKQSVLVGYFGLDEKYADFLANSIINMQQTQFDDPTSIVNATSRNLLRKIDAYVPDKVDVPGWHKLMAARSEMRDYWLAVDSLNNLEELKQKLQDETRKGDWKLPSVASISKKIADVELWFKLALSPLKTQEITLALQSHNEKVAAAKSKAEKMAAHAEMFRIMPFAALQKAKKKGYLTPQLEAQIDAARREMLSQTQLDFLKEHPDLAPYIERFIYTGSGARENWPEYKKIGSDLDFTIFLGKGVPIAIKEKIKTAFDAFFEKRAKFGPEELDIHCFVDEKPQLKSSGQDLDSIMAILSKPEGSAKEIAETRKNIEVLLRDLGDPERYLSTGALRFLQYLNKLGGKVKKASGDKLVDDMDYQAKIFKDVKFEDWMGMEIVLDNLKMIEQHSGGDRIKASEYADKYGLRILFARIIQTKKGLEMVNKLKIEDLEKNVGQTGGIHGEFVRMAGEVGIFSPQQMMLFKEMNLRKQGKPLGEVLAERNGGKVLADGDPALNSLLEQHITETEKFNSDSVRETITSNSLHMKKLGDAIVAAKDPHIKEALLLKYREILFSVSEVWRALPDNIRKTALSTAPAGNEMFRALEDVRNYVNNKQIEAVRSYNPFQKSGDVPQDDQPKPKN